MRLGLTSAYQNNKTNGGKSLTISEADLAYTAGIIDGEGNIGIYPNTSHLTKAGKTVHRMRVRVTNTDEWLIHWLKENYGGSIGVVDRGTLYGRNWKPAWWWTLSCNPALRFLKLILPYLRLKKPQAELAVRFQEGKHGRGRGPTPEELVVSEANRILIKAMNKRGL